MYEEKAVGKGGVRRRDLIAHPEAELDLVAQIRRGLDRNEFVLHYQPIVDLRHEGVVGCEALVRWRRGGKLLLPGVFLEAMERAGLMGTLSEWVIGQACRQQRAWREAGIDVRVSVNMPPMLLARRGAARLLRLAVTRPACASRSRSRR
jgi:EAL domain-containing protein (putative c-di-GMP-specific phosphodiesterase class I)